ncbi:hypothetical protein [Carnobacterium maltaromaticum]|uniref:hypothetical protein n=1 Tax=Carnobacterium maltaromaticum TaxID=2751 RepID=UPI0039AF3D45
MTESDIENFLKDLISDPDVEISDFNPITGDFTTNLTITNKMPTEKDYLNQINNRRKKIKQSEKKLINLSEKDATDENISSLLRNILAFDFGNGSHLIPGNSSYIKIKENQMLYRIRPQNTKMDSKSDAWYPPKECISYLGRLNDINESVLYVADEIETVLKECKIKTGDSFHLIVYKIITEISLIDISSIYLEGSQYPKVSFMVSDFLSTIFSLNVKEHENYKYKISNQIGKFFFPYSIHNFDGWSYPSAVIHNKKSIALNPESCDSKLRIAFVTNGKLVKEGTEVKLIINSPKFINTHNELVSLNVKEFNNDKNYLNKMLLEMISNKIKNIEHIPKDIQDFFSIL